MKKFYALTALLCLFSCAQPSQGNAAAPVVYEVFTSQNCPSCPPADEVLNEVAARGDVIALACHVSYLNDTRWSDPLSRDVCNRRQSTYNKAFGRGNRVFTPQAIINGTTQVNGTDRQQVSAALAAGAGVAPIALSLTPENVLRITMPQLAAPGGSYMVRVLAYRKNFQGASPMSRGRIVNYANAVHSLDDAGPPWQGEPRIVNFRLDSTRQTGAYAVIAQDTATGRIVAAGRIEQ